jgi:hypothetical protein
MTGVELGFGTGAGFTISGSICFGLISMSSGRDRSFSGMVSVPAGLPGAV